MEQEYKILGELLNSEEEFNAKFKEITGITQKEFIENPDEDGCFGHNFAWIKGNYIYRTDPYGFELEEVKD